LNDGTPATEVWTTLYSGSVNHNLIEPEDHVRIRASHKTDATRIHRRSELDLVVTEINEVGRLRELIELWVISRANRAVEDDLAVLHSERIVEKWLDIPKHALVTWRGYQGRIPIGDTFELGRLLEPYPEVER
jgi:hypothetical protein